MNTTIFSIRNGKTTLAFCDATCYNADPQLPDSEGQDAIEECNCLCAGLNHGVGRAQAIENTQAHGTAIAQTWVKEKALRDCIIFILPKPAIQLSLDELFKRSKPEGW